MSPEKHLLDWQTSQTIAESIAPTLGQLYRQKGVEVILFGKTLVNATTIDIIKAHRIAKRYTGSHTANRLNQSFNTFSLWTCLHVVSMLVALPHILARSRRHKRVG